MVWEIKSAKNQISPQNLAIYQFGWFGKDIEAITRGEIFRGNNLLSNALLAFKPGLLIALNPL
jgi:hypothetical protein